MQLNNAEIYIYICIEGHEYVYNIHKLRLFYRISPPGWILSFLENLGLGFGSKPTGRTQEHQVPPLWKTQKGGN